MTPDKPGVAPRYALLLNGSRFACAVLQELLDENKAPALLILPEYAPAVSGDTILHSTKKLPLQGLAGTIEVGYAPRTQQAKLASRLGRDSFEYLLVACWPYLIDCEVVTSVSRHALNLHPSLLPAYRGADPIGAQLDSGEAHPGVSLHLLSPRFDHGDILAQAVLPDARPARDRITFERQCARLGARLFAAILDDPEGAGVPWKQDPHMPIGPPVSEP